MFNSHCHNHIFLVKKPFALLLKTGIGPTKLAGSQEMSRNDPNKSHPLGFPATEPQKPKLATRRARRGRERLEPLLALQLRGQLMDLRQVLRPRQAQLPAPLLEIWAWQGGWVGSPSGQKWWQRRMCVFSFNRKTHLNGTFNH